MDDMFHQETGLDDEDDEDDGDGESSLPRCCFNIPSSLSSFCLIPYCTIRYSTISGHFAFRTPSLWLSPISHPRMRYATRFRSA